MLARMEPASTRAGRRGMPRARGLLVSASAALALTSACGGHAAPPRTIGSVPPARAAVDDEAGATAIAPPGGLARAFAAMPEDTDIVLGVDATQVRASPLFRRYEATIRAAGGERMAEVQRDCGFDVVASVTGFVIGARGTDALMFVNGLDRTRYTDCMARRIAARRATRPDARLLVDGDLVDYREGGTTPPLRLHWLGRRSMLFIKHGDDHAPAAELAAAAAARAGQGLTASPTFMALVQRARTDAPVWFVMRGAQLGAALPVTVRTVRGDLSLADDVQGTITLAVEDAAAARKLTDVLDQQLGQLRTSSFGGLASAVRVHAGGDAGDEVTIAFTLTSEQLAQLVALLGIGF